MYHFNVCEILRRLRLHPSLGVYLSSRGSFTGSHIFPVWDCPLPTGLLILLPLYSHFLCLSSLHPISIDEAPSGLLAHLCGPRPGLLNIGG